MPKVLSFFLLSICTMLVSSEDPKVTLPSAETLKNRLRYDVRVPHFTATTHIDKTLGGKTKKLSAVLKTMNNALNSYSEYMHHNSISDAYMEEKKPLILQAILKDNPKALESLQLNQ